MKILVVQESDWLARGPHQQHHLMEKLSLRSHEIRVIDYEIAWKAKWKGELCSRRQVFEKISKIHKKASVTVIRPGILRVPHLDYFSITFSHRRELERQMREFKPDVVVGLGILNTNIAMRLAKRRNIPFVYYLIDVLHTLVPFKLYQPIARAIERKTLRGAGRVLAINEQLRNYAISMGAEPAKTTVTRAGVDLERFNPKVDSGGVRKTYGIQRGDLVLLFMGWLYSFSGLKEVALELAKTRNEYPNVKILVVGDGDLFPELRAIKSKYGLEQLILAGRQQYDKIPSFISASDICLLPAHDNVVMRNIVPIKMYEYLACGKPIISTRLPGIMKEFGNDTGVIYVDEPSEVLKKVIEMCNDDKHVAECVSRGREFVEKYSWDRITDDFEDILKSISHFRADI